MNMVPSTKIAEVQLAEMVIGQLDLFPIPDYMRDVDDSTVRGARGLAAV